METWENFIKKIEKNILRLEVEPDFNVIFEIFELLQAFPYSEIPQGKEALVKQLKILVEEIKKEEVPLNRESIHTLSLIVGNLQKPKEGFFAKDEELSLIEEFFKEVEKLIEDIIQQKGEISSLLHRLKGTLGIYISLSKEKNIEMGKLFLKKVIELEKKAKEGIFSKEDMKEIQRLFSLLKEYHERI